MAQEMTAVEWLEVRLREMGFLYDVAIEDAKKMEKQQTIVAYEHGQNNGYSYQYGDVLRITGEEYFEETYKTQSHDKQQS